MVGMHFLYDVNVVFGKEPGWYLRPEVRIWQQSICWTFILIAGISFHLGKKRNLQRGLFLNMCGLVITAVTVIAMPEEAIWFGILNFIGCAVLTTAVSERLLKRIPTVPGMLLCALLFMLFRNISSGVLEVGKSQIPMPKELYQFRFLAPLGLPDLDFHSSDYFPMLPWYFLFLCGWYFGILFQRKEHWKNVAKIKIPILSEIGKNTIWIYMLHQPVLMALCLLFMRQ